MEQLTKESNEFYEDKRPLVEAKGQNDQRRQRG